MIKVLSLSDMDKIHNAALTVLQNTGLKIHGKFLLDILHEYGCKVDFEKMRVWFDPSLVEKQIAAQKHKYKQVRSSLWDPFCDEMPQDDIAYPDDFIIDYGFTVPHVLDMNSNIVRSPTQEDQLELILLGNAIDGVRAINSNVVANNFPSSFEVIEAAKTLLLNTSKPGWVGVYNAVQTRYLAELAQLFTGNNEYVLKTAPPLFAHAYCTTSPLKIDARTCEVLEEAIKYAFPVNFAPMPIMGMTTPITVAGSVVVATAEILGGITAVSLINPDLNFYSTSITSEVDMRTLAPCFATPSAVLTDAALHQLFKFKYGIVHNVDPAYVEGNTPSIQATFAKMFRLGMQAQTVSMPLPIGLLSRGSVFSGIQAMIDLDIAKAMYMFSRGIDTSDESLAVGLINELEFCQSENYLTSDLTLENYAELLWQSDVFDRSSLRLDGIPVDSGKENDKVLRRAYDKYYALLEKAPVYEAPIHIRNETERIVECARREILGE